MRSHSGFPRWRRGAIALPVTAVGLALLSASGWASSSGRAAGTSAPATLSAAVTLQASPLAPSSPDLVAGGTPGQPGTVSLTGMCGRVPVATVVEWQHAVGMVPADADGCIEDKANTGKTGIVEYKANGVNGPDILLIDTLAPDDFRSNAMIGSYPAELEPNSANTAEELIYIQVGSQFINVAMGPAVYHGLDQPTTRLLEDITAAAVPAGSAPADQPSSAAAFPGTPLPLSPCKGDTTPPDQPTTIYPIPKTTLGILGYILPEGMSYFGIGTQVGSKPLRNSLLVADSGFHCLDSGGYDSSLALDWADLRSADDPDARIFTYYAEDPGGNQDVALCFALLTADMPLQEALYAQGHSDCTGPAFDATRPLSASSIPVSGSDLTIGYAEYPPGTAGASQSKKYSTFEVQIFHYDAAHPAKSLHQTPITYIDCSEPEIKFASCRETLAEWTDEQLTALYGVSGGWAAGAVEKLRDRMSSASNATPVAEPVEASEVAHECRAPLNAKLEKKLAGLPRVKVDAAALPKEEPATPGLTIGVAFVPFGFHVCEQGLAGATFDPSSFEISPKLTVSDKDQGNHALGPFVYDATAHAWQSDPEIPPNQQLKTKFEPSFGVELLPGVYAALSPTKSNPKAGEVSLDLFALTLQAYPQVVDLWRDAKGPILQVTAAPQFELTVGVKLKELGDDLAETETAEGGLTKDDAAKATEQVARQDAQTVLDEAKALTGTDYPEETLHAVEAQFDVVIEESALADPALAAAETAAVEGDLITVEGESVLESLEDVLPQVAETAANEVITAEQEDS